MAENTNAIDVLVGNDRDEILDTIESLTRQRLCALLGGVTEIPPQLEYIVTEVSLARFNRVGSEGLTSHNVEGESMTFKEDDFAPYMGDIDAFSRGQYERGKVVFL